MSRSLATPMPILGVDVGGTKILVGTVDDTGQVIASHRHPMNRETTDSTLASIDAAIDGFFGAYPSCSSFSAVGLGLVGRCDPHNGVWVHADNLPVPQPVPLAAKLSAKLGVPVFLDNDVFCATTAELCFGVGREHSNFILINAGTGLSAGIVADGRLIRGAGNVAGEIGRTPLGIFDRCGYTLEECCSGGGILARAGQQNYADTRAVFDAAKSGDAVADKIIARAIAAISEATANLVTIFNPSAIVLAGSVAVNTRVHKAIAMSVRSHTYKSSLIDLQVVAPTQLPKGTAGLIGAAQTARLQLKNAAQLP